MKMAKNQGLAKREQPSSLLGGSIRSVLGLSLAAAGGWILYSRFGINHNAALPPALLAERKTYLSSAGALSYYHNGAHPGRPLVLIHSVNAAASAYEMRPLFTAYQQQRPVFALDLPGFGFSERSKRSYSPQLYEAAVLDFLDTQVGEAADVVALSLGCEFAARAALVRPERFHSLVLISPTGFRQAGSDRGAQQASQTGNDSRLYASFSFPLWSRPLFDLLTTRPVIRYFLQKSFAHQPPDDLVEYAYLSSHQPDAEHAPLYFISGKLFTPDIRRKVYEVLQVPSLVLYDRDAYTRFDMLPDLLMKNKAWQAIRLVPTLGMPHYERTQDTVEVLDKFWKSSTPA
jgi:pimeloyl-ACP methyl ester carboxylesterase